MHWFEGAIPEAIAESKRNQKVFLVYIEGNDELSRAMSQTYNDPGVSDRLKKSACVAVKLEAGSASCRQFSQIYPVVVIPSSFFIGTNGVPLEIVAGSLEPDAFLGKLDEVFKLYHESQKKTEHLESKLQSNDICSPSTSQSHQEVKQTVVGKPKLESTVLHEATHSKEPETFPSTSQAGYKDSSGSTSSPSSANTSGGGTDANSAIGLEQRIERAKTLIEARKNQKAVEEIEKEKEDEIKRRRLGKNMQKAQLQKQEQECKTLAQERAKEKAEERLARERVLAQIAQDRAERALRYQMQKAVAEQEEKEKKEKLLKAEQEKAALEASQRSKVARIQFRMPNGNFITHQFSADATLEEARLFVQRNVRPDFPNFTLSTTFPRRQFTANDYSQTLRDLQLAPSAALLILPVAAGTVIPQGKNMTLSVIWFLLSPFVMVWGFINNFLFGKKPSQNRTEPRSQSEDRDKPSTSHAQSGENWSASTSGQGNDNSRRGFYRRDGNIYRIASQNNDDDENNTWNGNSTQQM